MRSIRVRLVALTAVLFAVIAPATATSQNDTSPLRLGWTYAPPYFDLTPDLRETGFFFDLGNLLAEELGRSVEVIRYPTVQAFFEAQHDGETDIAAGVPTLTYLEETNLFSKPVAEAHVRLFMRNSGGVLPELDTVSGLRLGTLPPTLGSQFREILDRNTEVPFQTVQELFFALLAGDIDGIVTTHAPAFQFAREAGLEDRIVAIGPTFKSADRIVAIHGSRPDLLAPINEAIERISADGRLEALRNKYLLPEIAPVPETLRVAVFHSPPYGIIGEDGTFSGFSIDVFRELAERMELDYEFVEVAPEQYFAVPFAETADILPAFAMMGSRPAEFDISQPYEAVPLYAYMRSDDAATIPPDLAGLRIGVKPDIADLIPDAGFDPSEVVVEASDTALVAGLLDNRFDLIVDTERAVLATAEEMGVGRDIAIAAVDLPTVNMVIALRQGLEAIRARLNASIPAFTLSEDYQKLHASYFEEPEPWSPDPRTVAGALVALALILLLAGLLFQSARARKRADQLAAENRAVSGRLGAVLDAANSGIFGLSLDGQIVFANAGARHMLGGLDMDLPSDWPENIQFLDSEDMTPLESSHDPVKRALAGQTIKGETSILSRPGSIDPRYTRISSAPLSQDVSPDIGTVMIIDDVSEQEKNRQQVERASRLDALGQLTGGIAHDFNNLLAAIKYAIQLASVAKDEKKRVEYTDIALKSVTRGATLTQRLLAFAKRQPGVAKSRRVEDIVHELEELMRPTIEAHISLEFVVDDPNLWVFVDVAQLENAMLNLVLNARDAIMRSGQGNRIVIKARSVAEIEADRELRNESSDTYIAQGLHAEHRTDISRRDGKAYRYVEFSVTDNGPGMDDETKRRSIDPFFTTKDTNSGTGLGLSMVYGFIQQSDGEMRIYSEPGHGTTIRLLLPRGSTEGRREEPVERLPAPTGDGQVILIVEDEPDLLRIMSDLVESLGYSVKMARNGTEGLALLRSVDRIDVLLTDIVMPGGIGGFALAEAARKERPGLPIIYMSGYTGISTTEMGKIVAPLIQKPSPPYMLAEALEVALSEPSETEPTDR